MRAQIFFAPDSKNNNKRTCFTTHLSRSRMQQNKVVTGIKFKHIQIQMRWMSYNFKPYVKQLYLCPRHAPVCRTLGVVYTGWIMAWLYPANRGRIQGHKRLCEMCNTLKRGGLRQKDYARVLATEVFHTIWNKASLNLTYKIRAW